MQGLLIWAGFAAHAGEPPLLIQSMCLNCCSTHITLHPLQVNVQPRSNAGAPAGSISNFSINLGLIAAGPDANPGNTSALGLATLGSADGKPQAFSVGAGLLGSSVPSPAQDAAASSISLKVTLENGDAPAAEGSSATPGERARHLCMLCSLMV